MIAALKDIFRLHECMTNDRFSFGVFYAILLIIFTIAVKWQIKGVSWTKAIVGSALMNAVCFAAGIAYVKTLDLFIVQPKYLFRIFLIFTALDLLFITLIYFQDARPSVLRLLLIPTAINAVCFLSFNWVRQIEPGIVLFALITYVVIMASFTPFLKWKIKPVTWGNMLIRCAALSVIIETVTAGCLKFNLLPLAYPFLTVGGGFLLEQMFKETGLKTWRATLLFFWIIVLVTVAIAAALLLAFAME